MALTIPSYTEKRASQLRDAIRIIAWDTYKSENDVKGKEQSYKAYEAFKVEWQNHEIHSHSYEKIVEFAKDLGYEIKDLLAIRTEHYVRRNEMNGTAKEPAKSTNLADERFDF